MYQTVKLKILMGEARRAG